MIQDLACCSYLIHIIHEHFCCNRGSAALIREASFLTRRSYLVSRISSFVSLVGLIRNEMQDTRYASRGTAPLPHPPPYYGGGTGRGADELS